MMTYRWLVFAVGAALLGGAAWYFGRPEMPKEPPVDTNPILASSGLPEAPRGLPPKMIEVIDLASAYEPVREPQSPNGIDPASFLEDSKTPSRIPYAVDDVDIDSIEVKVVALCESFCERIAVGEKIAVQPREVPTPKPILIMLDVMPRVVPERMSSRTQSDLLKLIPRTRGITRSGNYIVGGPFDVGITQPVPPNASFTVPERLSVMPRELK